MSGPLNLVVPVVELMHSPGEMRELQLTLESPTHYGEGVVQVAEGETMSIPLRLESLHEGILASGEIHTRAQGECGRCLDPIELPIDTEFQELFAYLPDEAYDYTVVDETIDLDQIVRDHVVLALPFQPVCSPDCLGLDPATGEKRTSDTPTTTEPVVDPRWAELEKFLSQGDADHPDQTQQ